ncbi:transcription antitermination factor NusB [Helicobacter sp. 13S00477-4]|uniref:transcription antitermination factor NusB n=1 Tax=Helicobacter sp. 13S00477-4 TaxID=1905759 RepID=UPI000BA6B479|nr:transcription antitermination factor NusB [Helicobacter sp. 13S00477-4]PAF52835.1 N utilization substance protein B [Helicobacter sp. 13S00477-4]
MATRTQAREAVTGLLYAYDSGNTKIDNFAKSLLEEKKIKNKQQEFALELFKGVLDHLDELDELIKAHLKDWDFGRLGGMERAILRLGAFEIRFTQTDSPVIINEAVELGKIYGGDNAPKFINGVLDALHKICRQDITDSKKSI